MSEVYQNRETRCKLEVDAEFGMLNTAAFGAASRILQASLQIRMDLLLFRYSQLKDLFATDPVLTQTMCTSYSEDLALFQSVDREFPEDGVQYMEKVEALQTAVVRWNNAEPNIRKALAGKRWDKAAALTWWGTFIYCIKYLVGKNH